MYGVHLCVSVYATLSERESSIWQRKIDHSVARHYSQCGPLLAGLVRCDRPGPYLEHESSATHCAGAPVEVDIEEYQGSNQKSAQETRVDYSPHAGDGGIPWGVNTKTP